MQQYPDRRTYDERPYGTRWRAALIDDPIASATVTVTGNDLIVSEVGHDEYMVTFKLSGGRVGKTETITTRIVTVSGNKKIEHVATIKCR